MYYIYDKLCRGISSTLLLLCLCILSVSCKTVPSANEWLQQGKDLLNSGGQNPPSQTEIAAGLKDALRVGTATVVGQLGRTDGFNKDKQVHVPLPANMEKVRQTLNKYGMSSSLDSLELRLNRAAEAATPLAKDLFWSAIRNMRWSDAKAIYNGPDDAATRYFEKSMTPTLRKTMSPVIAQSLENVGAIKSYDEFRRKLAAVPFLPDAKADLTRHTLDKSLNGIFYYLAREETAIRRDPVKRTTDILKRVFGGT